MDHDGFAAWLDAIGRLTADQRGLAWRALALAEVVDDRPACLCRVGR